MKFSNGCWINQVGLEVANPKEVYEVIKKENSVEIMAPCNLIQTRGDTLAGPVLTYEISSPLKDVFKVRISHYKGTKVKAPHFELHTKKQPIEVITNPGIVEVKSGQMHLVMKNDKGFEMTISRAGKYLTSSKGKSF